MRVLTWLCVFAVVLALGFAAFSLDTGYVLISWGKTSVELSLVLAVIGAAAWTWLIARLVSLELWLRRASPSRISSKKPSVKPTPEVSPRKNWAPRPR